MADGLRALSHYRKPDVVLFFIPSISVSMGWSQVRLTPIDNGSRKKIGGSWRMVLELLTTSGSLMWFCSLFLPSWSTWGGHRYSCYLGTMVPIKNWRIMADGLRALNHYRKPDVVLFFIPSILVSLGWSQVRLTPIDNGTGKKICASWQMILELLTTSGSLM